MRYSVRCPSSLGACISSLLWVWLSSLLVFQALLQDCALFSELQHPQWHLHSRRRHEIGNAAQLTCGVPNIHCQRTSALAGSHRDSAMEVHVLLLIIKDCQVYARKI